MPTNNGIVPTREELEEERLRRQQQEDAEQGETQPAQPATPVATTPAPAQPASRPTATIGADGKVTLTNPVDTQSQLNNTIRTGVINDGQTHDFGRDQLANMQMDYNSALRDRVNEWSKLREAAIERDAKLQRNENWGSALAGVGTAISSLINLAGVSKNARNQAPATYAKEWMQKADARRKQRQDEIDDLALRQRIARDKLVDARLSWQQAMINRDDAMRKERTAQRQFAAKMQSDNYWKGVTASQNAQKIAIQKDTADANRAHQASQDAIAQKNAETNAYRARVYAGGQASSNALRSAQEKYYNTRAGQLRGGSGHEQTFQGRATDGKIEKIPVNDTDLQRSLLGLVPQKEAIRAELPPELQAEFDTEMMNAVDSNFNPDYNKQALVLRKYAAESPTVMQFIRGKAQEYKDIDAELDAMAGMDTAGGDKNLDDEFDN